MKKLFFGFLAFTLSACASGHNMKSDRIPSSNECTVEGGNKTVSVGPTDRDYERAASDSMGRELYRVRISPGPGDEFFDPNNLSVAKANQYNGGPAAIQPKDKRVYETQRGGLTFVLKGKDIVVEKTGMKIATAHNCSVIDSLLGGYAIGVTL